MPEHWAVKSLNRLTTSIRNGTSATQVDEAEDTVPVTRIESISAGRIDFDKVGQVEWSKRLEPYRLNRGDILLSHINSLSMVGNCAFFDSESLLYSGMNLLRLEPEASICASWLWRVLTNDGIRKEISARAKPAINQASVTTTQIKSLQLPVPPLIEQQAIAEFLDRDTGRIDRLVAKKRELIERLKEKRTALISRTVTRGLPPAAARAAGLPENPGLNPSGVEWLGDIPAHWEVKSLTRLTLSIRNGTSATQLDDAENTVPVTRIESISGGRINFDKVGQVEWTPAVESFRLKKGDILLSHINSLSMVGNCALLDSDVVLYSGMNLLRIQSEPTVHAPWLWRAISSDGIRKEISSKAKPAINQASVTTTQIKSLQLPVPPQTEQQAIAAYLDAETAKLDALVAKVETAIERLQEYRTALVTAAVTGKIDVRTCVPVAPYERDVYSQQQSRDSKLRRSGMFIAARRFIFPLAP